MSVPSSRARHGLQALLLSVVLVPLCSAACIEEACRFTGGKQISPVMVGVFVVALVALLLATQSSFAAYLGVAVAKQWPEPKLSGIPYNDGMHIGCARIEISLYYLNILLACSWIAGLSVYTWVWCDLTGSGKSCCTTGLCILIGIIFWMVPGMHVCVSIFMAVKFAELGWPHRGVEVAYAPIPGVVVTGLPDVVAGMPADGFPRVVEEP